MSAAGVGTAGAPAAATIRPPQRLGLALAVIATARLVVVLDATIVDVALPHIQGALGFSGSNLEWVVNAYALAFGGLLLLGGRLAMLGRRRIFIARIVLFRPASLLGALPPARPGCWPRGAAQGIGGALARRHRAVADRDHVPRGAAAQSGPWVCTPP